MAAKMAVVHRPAGEASFLRAKKAPSLEPAPLKAMTEKDFDFINRMDSDVEGRRRTAFMEQLKKDPRFRPEMLEPAKSKFQTVTLVGGPIVKTHKSTKNGYEGQKHKWGPLGGWY